MVASARDLANEESAYSIVPLVLTQTLEIIAKTHNASHQRSEQAQLAEIRLHALVMRHLDQPKTVDYALPPKDDHRDL